VNAGAAVDVAAGFRFVKRLYMGLKWEHGFLTAAGGLTANLPSGGTANADSNYVGLDFAVISDPNAVAFFAKVGAGYRFLDLGATLSSGTFGETFSGGEASLGAGVELKLGSWIRLIPEASVNIGSFSQSSCSSSGTLNGSLSSFNGFTGDHCGSLGTDTHEFVLLGLTAFLDFARKN
jgi:hypothetical protein